MGYLDANRVLDPDDGEQFVIAHKDLEVALSEIFGIPLERRITQSILGTVAADGSFTLIRLKSKPGVQAANAVGVEFTDGLTTKRILYVDSRIKVYNKVGQAWQQVHDFESEDNPNLTDLEDVDKSTVKLIPENAEKILYTILGQDNETVKFSLTKNEVSTSGATSFKELNEVGLEWDNLYYNLGFPGYLPSVSGANSLSQTAPANAIVAPPWVWSGNVSSMAVVSNKNTTNGWVICGPWVSNAGPRVPQLVTLGGRPSGGVVVPRGLYEVNLTVNVVSSVDLKGEVAWGPLAQGIKFFPKPANTYMLSEVPYYLLTPVAGPVDYIYPISSPSSVVSQRIDLGTHILAITENSGVIGAQIGQSTTSQMVVDVRLTIVGIK